MKDRGLAGLMSAALLASTAAGLQAGLTHNHYAPIAARNVFGLKPLSSDTKTPLPTPLTPAPGVEVFLTGIFTVGGTERVLLLVADKTPGKKAEHLPPLVEKDVQGRVEVVSIDADKGAVVIRIDGDERTLTFAQEAPKAGGAVSPVRPPLPNPLVRTGGPVLLPPPPALGAAPSTVPSKSGVWVGGANASSPPLPVAPSANWSGAMNRGIPVAPTPPPRMSGREAQPGSH